MNKQITLLKKNENEVKNTKYRLGYHIAAPIGGINDPNGLVFFRGEYHVFYQYYPYEAEWGPMHWGHAKSKDLINWVALPVALAPEFDYEKGGCFSGSAAVFQDKLYLIYTGHNEEKNPKEVQCIAVSEDGIHFVMGEGCLSENTKIIDRKGKSHMEYCVIFVYICLHIMVKLNKEGFYYQMTAYRKRMFRGAKIEDCILDFSKMARTTARDKQQGDADEALFNAGMNAAFTFVVNRLAREFDYKRGDEALIYELKNIKTMFLKKAEEAMKQSRESVGLQADNAFYDQIPEEAKAEINNIPQEFQQGMFEGIAMSYEGTVKDLGILIESDGEKTPETIKELIKALEGSAKSNRKKGGGEGQTYRDGLYQGLVAGFEIAAYEIKETFQGTLS
ncbi:hypothetical protein JSY36_09235 [Bacillus sp. H-16]|uniref:glycoside hydrolase family 32 protein n=1 Tax=Alteribacter salitolerans TaxID=2912333 RepID=UPI001965CF37|nr:hypothetical protein [Alteribacter salitolerans]MBM7095937.1 hypothetical protein [Alteribacter salitolerans]